MSMSLVEFLRARLDEDEEVARKVRPDEHLRTRDAVQLAPAEWGGYATCAITSGRVLAECEAKREIVRIAQDQLRLAQDDAGGWDNWRDMATQTLGALAAVYADHPDYLEEWRP